MRRAFTLIELLVVIAIIAILAAILFPVFAQAKLSAIKTKALAQSKQLATSLVMYATDHDDNFVPASLRSGQPGDPEVWPPKLLPYVKSKDLFVAANTDGKFAEDWNGRRNQNIGYNDATGIDAASTAVPGAAPAGTEGFTSAASFSLAEESAKTGLIAFTPNSVNGKERGYVFNPYNGPNDPNGAYNFGLPLIGDVNLCTTPYKGVNYSTRAAGALKPIFARYGGDGSGNGQTPVIFADGHARLYTANRLQVFGEIIWRFR